MLGRALFGVFVLSAGCAIADDEPEDGSTVDGRADGPSEFKLRVSRSTGKHRAKESPRLPGAPPTTKTFSCATETRTADGWRMLCERNAERLSLTFGPSELAGAAIYTKSTSSPDSRAFYRCTAASAVADEWPSELSCVSKSPKSVVDGQLVSPFSSSLDDIGIFNSHLVSEAAGAKLFRSMKPFRPADLEDVEALGVGAVLIFKKPTSSTEVTKETAALAPIGIAADHVVNVPFPFKDFGDFAEPCRMTVRALAQLEAWAADGTTALVHCTVGEDRTGYLAGLYRLLNEQTAVGDVFQTELCERGYSSGNPQKPLAGVVNEIDADLTPLFLKMAFKIATGELTKSSLDDRVCDVDPAADPAFAVPQFDPAAFRCAVSTRYRL